MSARGRASRIARRAAPLLAALICALVVNELLLRPWFLAWGTEPRERDSALAGDGYVAPHTRTTRAITIDAPPDEVWAWLSQIGQDRGGFYSFEVLEDAVGARMTNAERVLDVPTYRPGDVVWMAPPDAFDGSVRADVLEVHDGRALVLGTRQMGRSPEGPIDGTWSFVVQPVSSSSSRLLVRSVEGGARSGGARLFDRLVLEPVRFIMERRMLQGIALRAEGRASSKIADDLDAHAMILGGLALLFGGLQSVRSARPRRAFGVALLAASSFQLVTLVEPSFLLAVALVALQLLVALRGPRPLLPAWAALTELHPVRALRRRVAEWWRRPLPRTGATEP